MHAFVDYSTVLSLFLQVQWASWVQCIIVQPLCYCAIHNNAAQHSQFCASFSFLHKLLISTRSSHCNVVISSTSSFSNGRNISKTFSAAFLYFIASCTLHHHQYHIDSQAFDACICHHHCMHHHSFLLFFYSFLQQIRTIFHQNLAQKHLNAHVIMQFILMFQCCLRPCCSIFILFAMQPPFFYSI